MAEHLHRVMFDTNDSLGETSYWLGFERSKLDLKAIGAELEDGLVVTIYMPEELEMNATLRLGADRWGSTKLAWWADVIPGTVRYLDRSD